MNSNELVLLLDEIRGIYIPQQFARIFTEGTNLLPADREILLAGPGHELYWEVWDDVLSSGTYTINGIAYTLHQDGDLWAVHPEYEWPEYDHNQQLD